MAKKPKYSPFKQDDWTEETLSQSWDIIKKLATDKYKLNFYKPAFEVVSFEDMLHIYTGSLPIMYDHWSFGKSYEQYYKMYAADRMGVAYEVIFNTSPALCYLLEHNSPTMQGLVQCHASVGHSAFFKNNVLFKELTNAATIIPFLKNAKEFIAECETKFGSKEVEKLLDACHALQLYAFNRRPEVNKTNKEKEQIRLKRLKEQQEDFDTTLETIKLNEPETYVSKPKRLREENILQFIGKFSPSLKLWQREIISIYCKIQQYLYPQMLTKLMNEGFASFWHHTLMNDLVDMGYIDDGGALEFLHSHCSVLRQTDFDDPRGYGGINPYKLGFEMFKDIKRICEEPTIEDKEWFPNLVNTNWIEAVKFAAYNFKDESFILQYLSPKLMRDLKLFVVNDDAENVNLIVSDIHDDEGYKTIRNKLAKSYNFINRIPDVYIEGWDAKKSRTLFICFQEHDDIEIDSEENTTRTINLIKSLWPFQIMFKYIHTNGTIEEGSI